MRFSSIAPVVASAPVQCATASKGVPAKSKFNRYGMSKSARRFLLESAIMAMIYPVAASASEDDKVYAGAACQPTRSSDLFVRRADGGVQNAGTSTQTWVCPVVRDFAGNATIEFGAVTILEAAGQRTICTLVSRTETGGSFGALSGSSTILGAIRKFTFGLGSANAVNVAQNGALFFSCLLPSQSAILNYRTTENVGED